MASTKPRLLKNDLPAYGLGGTGDSQRDSRESIRVNHSQLKPPIFIAHQADSPESLEFPMRANHPIRANRVARITPLSSRRVTVWKPPITDPCTDNRSPDIHLVRTRTSAYNQGWLEWKQSLRTCITTLPR